MENLQIYRVRIGDNARVIIKAIGIGGRLATPPLPHHLA